MAGQAASQCGGIRGPRVPALPARSATASAKPQREGSVAKKSPELLRVWPSPAFSQNPCWIAICSSSAPCSCISSLIISGPIPKARSTRRTSPLMPG